MGQVLICHTQKSIIKLSHFHFHLISTRPTFRERLKAAHQSTDSSATAINGHSHPERDGPEPHNDQKQAPQPARSPATISQIRVRNRRREYLRQNPTYLDDLEHELAGP